MLIVRILYETQRCFHRKSDLKEHSTTPFVKYYRRPGKDNYGTRLTLDSSKGLYHNNRKSCLTQLNTNKLNQLLPD